MRNLFTILNLILCFELIVSPLAPNLSLVSEARAEGCPPGLQMDPTLNRCLTTAQTANVMNATASCAQGDVACYRENAQKAFQDKVNAGDAPERKKDNGFVSFIASSAVMTGTLAAVYGMASSTGKCASPSFWAMIAAGAAVVAGETIANMGHKKRLKKIKEDWGKIVNPEQAGGDKDKEREASIEAQSQAFEMLAQSEDSLAKAAKLKKNFYMIATAAYAAAVVISLLEIKTNASLKAASVAANTTAFTTNTTVAGLETAFTPTVPFAASATASASAVSALNSALGYSTRLEVSGASAGLTAALSTEATATLATLTATSKTVTTTAAANVTAQASASTLATAAALVPATTALASPIVPLAIPAGANSTAAATAGEAYVAHTTSVVCIPLTAVAQAEQQSSKGIFAQYTSKPSLDIRQEIQFQYNLANSSNFSSFIMNKKEMDGELSQPIDEYLSYKNSLAELETEDRTVFEIFKATSMSFIFNLSPIAPAFAVEQDNIVGADESSSGGGSGTGSSSSGSNIVGNVDTNAAKTYQEDKAKGPDLLGYVFKGLVAGAIIWNTTLGAKLITSSGRAILSGVVGGLTLLTAMHAGKQAEASEKRAALLRKMKDEFNLAAGAVNACKSEDRNDPGKPTCYCYTPENQRNNNRGNSAVCQKLWAGINLTPGKYNGSNVASSKVCINNSGRTDPTCACKATKSCMKAGLSGLKGLNTGTMSMLGQSLAPLNGVANGSIDAANVNAGALENQASRLNLIAKELEKDKSLAGYRKNKDKLSKAILADIGKIGEGITPSDSSGGSNMPSNPKDAALMLEKELDQPLPTGVAGGDQIMAPSNSPAEEGLEFGMTADQLADQEGQIAEVMNQDLDYGGNDINQGSKTNIFDVLSNRYQRSGMRRLFDEKGTTEAEKPAATDIAQ